MTLFELMAKLVLDKSDYDKGLDDAEKKTSGFGDKIKGAMSGVKAAGLALGAAGAVAGAAVIKLTKDAVSAYADYEQLAGGVETLFGAGGKSLEEYAESVGKTTGEAAADYEKLMNAQEFVMNRASAAWDTAGLSANEYMETVTGFSASLIQSLGGDTEAAARMADQAIIDMSDNANKMGTDMTAIQNAYSGFARGNFAMLDNLKLGYAGSKEEMERLLTDAEKIKASQGEMVDYSIDNYADMIEAIHTVQTEMGITGTTAKEGATTVSGSANRMKAAWENVVTNFAKGGTALQESIWDFLDSAKDMASNLIPVISSALKGIGEFVMTAVPEILETLPPMLLNLVPQFISATTALVSSVLKTIPSALKGFGKVLGSVKTLWRTSLSGLSTVFLDAFTQIGDLISDLISMMSEELVEGIPTLLENVLPMIESFSEAFREGAGRLTDVGIDFILNLARGIMDSLPTLIEQVPQIITNFAGAINDNAPKLLVGGVQLILTIVQGIISAIPMLIANIPQIFQAFLAVWTALNWVNLGENVIELIKNGIDQLKTTLPQALKDIGSKAIEWLKGVNWANAGAEVISFVTNGIATVFNNIPAALKSIASIAIEWFKGIDWAGTGSKIISFVTNGIATVMNNIPFALKAIALTAINWFNSIDWAGAGSAIISFITNGMALLINNIPIAIKTIGTTAITWFKGIDWAGAGSAIISFITNGMATLINNIPIAIKTIGTTAAEWFKSVDWVGTGSKIIAFVTNGIATVVNNIPSAIKAIASTAIDWFKGVDWLSAGSKVISFVTSGIATVVNNIPSAIKAIATKAIDWFKGVDWLSAGSKVIVSIVDGIATVVNNIPSAIKAIGNTAIEWIKGLSWLDVGKNIIQGMVDGVTNAAQSLIDAVTNVAQNAFNAVTGFFKIGSPSKLMRDGVGKWVALGIGEGFKINMPTATKSMVSELNKTYDEIAGNTRDTISSVDMFGRLSDIDGMITMNGNPQQVSMQAMVVALQYLTTVVEEISDTMSEKMTTALNQMGFNIDGREFARLVRGVGTT